MAKKIDRWWIVAISTALWVGFVVVMAKEWPDSFVTWAICAATATFGVVAYFNPQHWLKRRSGTCLGIAGAAAAIPAIAGAIRLPDGWVEVSTSTSPWVAAIFGVVSLGFAWLDRTAPGGELMTSIQRVADGIEQLQGMTIVAPPQVSLAVEKARIEAKDPRIKVEPSATLDGVRFEIVEGEVHGSLRLEGSPEQLAKAHEKIKRGDLVDAAELGLRIVAVNGPGFPGETIEIKQLQFGDSTAATLSLIHVGRNGAEYGSAEIQGVIQGGLEKRFNGSLGDGLFSIELGIGGEGGRLQTTANYKIGLKVWNGVFITQLPGFNTLSRVFSRLPEGGTLQFQLFLENKFLVSGHFDENAVKQLAPMGATLHWLKMARKVCADLGANIRFGNGITKEDTYEIELAKRFIDGETLPLKVNGLCAHVSVPSDAVTELLDDKSPITLQHPEDHFFRSLLGTQVDLGPTMFLIRDCNQYVIDVVGPDDNNSGNTILSLQINDVTAEATRTKAG